MFIKGKKATQMSLFERAFGIRDFLQEIMCEEGDSRVDVMWLNAWKLRDFEDFESGWCRFCWNEIMWKLE